MNRKYFTYRERQINPFKIHSDIVLGKMINEYIGLPDKKSYDEIIFNAVSDIPFKSIVARELADGTLVINSVIFNVFKDFLQNDLPEGFSRSDLAKIESTNLNLIIVQSSIAEKFDLTKVNKY